jgi:peptidoglycan hydrolase CwlO-like protein
MIDASTIKEIVTVAGSVAAASVAAVLGLRKSFKHWEKDGLEIERSGAEEVLIKSLRQETERLATQNQKLMEQLLSLQLQLGNLHQSITKLRTENDHLNTQIKQLKAELDALRGK